jgi:hypothetical protein
MTEDEFWLALRFRLNSSSELSSLGYCDWFTPKRYFLGPPNPRIDGRVGFLGGPGNGEYEFSISLPTQCENLNDLDWSRLIPDPDTTGWAMLEDDRLYLNGCS